jgi:hypothetical protein
MVMTVPCSMIVSAMLPLPCCARSTGQDAGELHPTRQQLRPSQAAAIRPGAPALLRMVAGRGGRRLA